MPEMDGYEACWRVREWSQIPIIMLSAREGETDKVKCLDSGADDYLTKPFSLKELLSRINAVLRRVKIEDLKPDKVRFQNGELLVDFALHMVTLSGDNLDLTGIEYKIIAYLAANVGRIITTNQLLEKVWGEGYFGDSSMIQVHVYRLRRKIKDNTRNPKYIQTRSGIGYMMLSPP
jgi:DNA-binding response OmpR family regulator